MRVSVTGNTPKSSYTVRLLGIDTPEIVQPNTPVECGGREAVSTMLYLTFPTALDSNADGLLDQEGMGPGVGVDLTMDPTQGNFDSSNRLLAYIDVRQGERTFPSEYPSPAPAYDLSRSMIQTGYSEAFTSKRRVRRFDSYRSAEDEARAAGRGVWTQCGGDFHL